MSQENVETVRRGYEVIQQWLRSYPGELAPLDEFLDPEIEWRGPREFPDLAEPKYGHEGVRRYTETLFEAIEDYRMVPEEFIDAGPRPGARVLARGRTRKRQWSRGFHPAHGTSVDDPRRQGGPNAELLGALPGPRSRRAVGVALRPLRTPL